MIKGLQGSMGVVVDGGNTSLQYVSPDNNNPLQGMVRVWGTDLQVFSNGVWQNIPSSYATVRLDATTYELIEWARKKREEERQIEALAADHPAVKIAKENLNKVKENLANAEKQLKATVILSKEYEK
jgi:hypothetical protein